MPDDDLPLLFGGMIRIVEDLGQWIGEDGQSLGEGHVMLGQVGSCLARIPFENEAHRDERLPRRKEVPITVTPEDIQRMTAKYIQDDKATIVVAGDRKVIEEQVKPYGKITS